MNIQPHASARYGRIGLGCSSGMNEEMTMSLSDHQPYQRLITDEPSEHDLQWINMLAEVLPTMKDVQRMGIAEARELCGLIALRVRHQ